MRFTFGYTAPTTVEVTNRQQHVEYKILTGFADERDVRAAVGNAHRGTYSHYFSGWYNERSPAIERIEEDIRSLKKELLELEFALKVTKKKKWVLIKD
jgi:hypothetical protein